MNSLQFLLVFCHCWYHRFPLRPILGWFGVISFGLCRPSLDANGLQEAGFGFLPI